MREVAGGLGSGFDNGEQGKPIGMAWGRRVWASFTSSFLLSFSFFHGVCFFSFGQEVVGIDKGSNGVARDLSTAEQGRCGVDVEQGAGCRLRGS